MGSNIEYTDAYIDSVFYLWYEMGKKVGSGFLHALPATTEGKIVSRATIMGWLDNRGWRERADALDAEASRALDVLVIDRRKKMYEEQVRVADELVAKGMEFLNDKGIQTDASAIRAIDLGLATQRSAIGMAELHVKISKMSDEQMDKELQRLLGRKEDDSVDAEVIEEEE